MVGFLSRGEKPGFSEKTWFLLAVQVSSGALEFGRVAAGLFQQRADFALGEGNPP